MNTSSVPVVGAAGDAVRLNLGMGTDEDHDGMSDLWETQLIIWNSGGQYSDVSEVLPGDIFDGDGVPNIDEFNAGTALELAGDVFQVYKWMLTADNLLAVRFLTVQGTTYEIQSAPAQVRAGCSGPPRRSASSAPAATATAMWPRLRALNTSILSRGRT